MGGVITQLQTDYDGSLDRRAINLPVENDRRAERKIHNETPDYATKCVFEALPPVRRLSSAKEDWEKGDTAKVMGALALTAVNAPEDLRDIQVGLGELHAKWKGLPYQDAYNYKDFQHEFSFFRGTLLEPLVDMKKHPKLAPILLKFDNPLTQTRFGEKVMSWLKVYGNDFEEVKGLNKKTNCWEVTKDLRGNDRYALGFSGGSFGKITARAMCRTTVIGTSAIALLELPKILKACTKGENILEQGENGAEQLAKSGINVASITAGIAYGGAIGSKYGKCFGSLVGMGTGAVLGGIVSKKIQEKIN